MFTSLYLAFFQENVISFLLFLAVVPSAINVLFAYFINFVPFEQSGETPASTGAPGYPFFLLVYCHMTLSRGSFMGHTCLKCWACCHHAQKLTLEVWLLRTEVGLWGPARRVSWLLSARDGPGRWFPTAWAECPHGNDDR